jgi:hypothetical protein
MFGYFKVQMTAGQKYMDSITDKDVPVWIERTRELLSEYEPGTRQIGAYDSNSIPPDLKKLKIIRIDIGEDYVGYVWMGGLDHTELIVHHLTDGSFQFLARYNDARSRVIWPKE